MSENTRTCLTCCTPVETAGNSSEVTSRVQDLTQYIYASTIQGATGKPVKYSSQTSRIQTLIGKITTPQALALQRNGGVPCSNGQSPPS